MARSGRDEQNARLYFREETEEGNESVDESGSDASEEDVAEDRRRAASSRPESSKTKKTLKICRHFAYSLISNAVEMGWEEQEIANLIKLVANQLDFNEAQLIRCLENTATGSPATISCLLEGSDYSFSTPQLVSVILSNARNTDHFIALMGEACECDLFDLSNADTVTKLHMFVENNMDLRQSQRYARLLCEHSDNKRLCGRILHTFTAHMSPAEAASYLYDIVTLDFFQDMRGSMKECLSELPRARDELEDLLNASHQRDKEGEILDSDADSDGNLRDFVVESDSDARSSDGSADGSASDGNDSDGNSSDANESDGHSSDGASDAYRRSKNKLSSGKQSKHTKKHDQAHKHQSAQSKSSTHSTNKSQSAPVKKRAAIAEDSEGSDNDSSAASSRSGASASSGTSSSEESAGKPQQRIKKEQHKHPPTSTAQSKKRPHTNHSDGTNSSGSDSDGAPSKRAKVKAEPKKEHKNSHNATAAAALVAKKQVVVKKANLPNAARAESSGSNSHSESASSESESSDASSPPVPKARTTVSNINKTSKHSSQSSGSAAGSSGTGKSGRGLTKTNANSSTSSSRSTSKSAAVKQEDDIFEVDGEAEAVFSRGVISDY